MPPTSMTEENPAIPRWRVVRTWYVTAERPDEALDAARPGEHDQAVAHRLPPYPTAEVSLKSLPLSTNEELDALSSAIAMAITQVERNLRLGQSRVIRDEMQRRWNLLNSWRTSVAEAMANGPTD